MKTKICVQDALLESLRDFLRAEGIGIEAVTDESCPVKILQCEGEERLRSDLRTIYSGGWIACETARALAKKLGISLVQMGKVINHLNTKIRQCSLGCF